MLKNTINFTGTFTSEPAGSDIITPSLSLDNEVVRFNGTTGTTIQGSNVFINDTQGIAGIKALTVLEVATNPGTDKTLWVRNSDNHLLFGAVDLLAGSGGSGDVVGAASSTDNAIVRFDATSGKIIQNSLITIGDTGMITLPNIKYPIIRSDQVIVGIDRTDKYLGYGRNGNKTNTVMMGIVSGSDSNTVSDAVILGNNSCTIGSGNQVDVIAVGNDIGTASGSRCVVLGNRVSVEPTTISSLGSSNLVMGHDIDLRNGSLSNIIFGNSAKVNGNANVSLGEKIFNAGCVSNSNTVLGYGIAEKISSSQSANNNVLIGTSVLALAVNSCSSNILIGGNVGNAITTSVNDCLWIEDSGANGETNTTRIGKSTKSLCYIAGIHSSFTPSNTQKNVKINSDGRLVGTNETRPYGCHTVSFSNTRVVGAGAYTFSYTANSNLTLPIGGTPTSSYSTSFFSVGAAAGSFKYTGASSVSVRYTWTFCPSMLGQNYIITFYLVKNGTVVPNTLLSSATLQLKTTTAVFVFTLSTNDEIQIGYTTSTTSGGNVNVYNDTRFVEIIA